MRELSDEEMLTPPRRGPGEVSTPRGTPGRREVVATASPRPRDPPAAAGSRAGESASEVRVSSRRATQPVGHGTGSSGASEEVMLLRQQLAEMRREHAAAMAAIREEMRAAREGQPSSGHLPTVGRDGPTERPIPSPRASLPGTPRSRAAMVEGGVWTPPGPLVPNATPLPMVGEGGRRVGPMSSVRASLPVTSLSPRPLASRTDTMESGVRSPPRPTTGGERDAASPTLPAQAGTPSPPRTYAQVVAGSPATNGLGLTATPLSPPAVRPEVDGAFGLLQRQMEVMKDTLRCVEERVTSLRGNGNGSSNGKRRREAPQQQQLSAPPPPTRVITESGRRWSRKPGASGLEGAPGVSRPTSSHLGRSSSRMEATDTPTTGTESLQDVKEQLVEIANAYRAPPVSITPFAGEALDFPRFREEVKAGIEDTIPPNKGRLARLLAVLKGDPKLLCTNLHMFGDQRGFEIGMERLCKKYGHLPTLVNAWREKLASTRGRTCQEWYLALQGCVDALKASNAVRMMGTGQALRDVVEHLPERARRVYAAKVALAEDWDTELPSLEDLLTVVKREASLEAAEEPYKAKNSRPALSTKRSDHRGPGRTYHTQTNGATARRDTQQCTECGGQHELSGCRDFERLSQSEKRAKVIRERRCYRCLGSGHRAAECPNRMRCRECDRPHATAAHDLNVTGTPSGQSQGTQKRRRSPPRARDASGPAPAKRRKNTRAWSAKKGGQKTAKEAGGEVHHATSGQH